MALTSMCEASQGATSAARPVSTLMTPPGTSEVASTTTVFPVTTAVGRARLGTSARTSLLAGEMVLNAWPSALGVNSPLMNSPYDSLTETIAPDSGAGRTRT
jgi:hypothetical protein